MTFFAENLAAFDMIKSIPAEDLNACVAQALSGIAQHYPQASLPSADWVLKARAKELVSSLQASVLPIEAAT